jgi:hypothetical protein
MSEGNMSDRMLETYGEKPAVPLTAEQRLDKFWAAVYNTFDIETREYFEREAPKSGNWTPEEMCVHHIWKRDPRVTELTARMLRAERKLEDATRICDHPGCTAVVVRHHDGSRHCAAGHGSRFVDAADLAAAQHILEEGWPNGCERTVPAALRYLASHPRPSGGEENFNAAHLYQLANEIEVAAGKRVRA